MKKRLVLTAATLLVVGLASADLGSVVNSFPIPFNQCYGLARANDVLFSLAFFPGRVWLCSYTNGSVVDSFPAAGGGNTRGICYSSGGYLWQNQPLSSPYLMYQTNSSNGSVYSSFSLPGQYYTGAAPLATGDGGEGTTRIIVSNYDTKTIAYLTTAGSVVHSHATSQGLFEIAFDWRNRLIWGGTDSAAVNGYDTNGSLIASFKSPTTGNVHGITYHGEYLWVAGVTGLIYQIHCPACVGVKPASMGKLKAMFR